MIVVTTVGRMVTISVNGGEALGYSPAFVVSTTASGAIRITNMGDGTQLEGAYNEWVVNGKSYPELPDKLSVIVALNKAVRKWTAL